MPTHKQLRHLGAAMIRPIMLRFAHKGIMAGHQGINRSEDRFLEEFYGPGLQADSKQFAKSCDV